MDFTTKSVPFICFILLLSFFIHGSYSLVKQKPPPSDKFLEPYRIFVTDRDIPTMIFQCPPGGDERGLDILTPRKTITWHFRRNFWETTRFDCNFYWLKGNNEVEKSITVAVFNKRIAKMCGENLFHMNRCYWIVSKDGFYLSKDNGTFPNENDWQVVYTW